MERLVEAEVQQADVVRPVVVQVLHEERRLEVREVQTRRRVAVGDDRREREAALDAVVGREADLERERVAAQQLEVPHRRLLTVRHGRVRRASRSRCRSDRRDSGLVRPPCALSTPTADRCATGSRRWSGRRTLREALVEGDLDGVVVEVAVRDSCRRAPLVCSASESGTSTRLNTSRWRRRPPTRHVQLDRPTPAR